MSRETVVVISALSLSFSLSSVVEISIITHSPNVSLDGALKHSKRKLKMREKCSARFDDDVCVEREIFFFVLFLRGQRVTNGIDLSRR